MACSTDSAALPCAIRRTALIVLSSLLLAACGGLPRSDRPAAVEERSARPAAEPPGAAKDTQVAAYTPPAVPRTLRAEPSRAVSVLAKRADDQRRAGELDAAVVSMERALRIAPDDAQLWQQLAQIRQAQGRHDLVVQLAAKSNALALPGDGLLQRDNWLLIAASRQALGDTSGAREAQRRAAALR